MKRLFAILTVATLVVGCSKIDDAVQSEKLVVKGYSSCYTRTEFGTPDSATIPFLWSEGDYIYLGAAQSDAIGESGEIANFTFSLGTPGIIGGGHIFYNMTGATATPHKAKVLATQSADGNLGNDGDFGYASLDAYNSFYLKHKTAYIWFNTTTADSDMPKLSSITFEAPEGVNIAGEREYNHQNDEWADAVTNGSNVITLNFEGGYALQSANEGVMAAMVCLPAEVADQQVKITYAFEDGKTYTEQKSLASTTNFEAGCTARFSKQINKADLVEPAPEYELRVLTFEDTPNFTPYSFTSYYYDEMMSEEYKKTYNISNWSDLIPQMDYGDEMVYGIFNPNTYTNAGTAGYYWSDPNTHLYHEFPPYLGYDWMTDSMVETKTYQRQGEVLSRSYAPPLTDATLPEYQGNYYDQGYGYFGGERYVYASEPVAGNTFCVHHGYSDFFNTKDKLSGFEFNDGKARVIKSMDVANTSYAYYQLKTGFSFGVNYTGVKPTTQFKIVAYGYKSADDTNPEIAEFFLVKDGVIVEDWTSWDLSALGPVVRVEFNMVGSPFDLLDRYDKNSIPDDIDDLTGRYGLAAPGYFAYDNIAVWVEK